MKTDTHSVTQSTTQFGIIAAILFVAAVLAGVSFFTSESPGETPRLVEQKDDTRAAKLHVVEMLNTGDGESMAGNVAIDPYQSAKRKVVESLNQ